MQKEPLLPLVIFVLAATVCLSCSQSTKPESNDAPDSTADTGTGRDTDITQTDVDSDSDSDTDTDGDADSDSDTDTESDPDTDSDSHSDDVSPSSDSNADTAIDDTATTRNDTNTSTDSHTDTGLDTNVIYQGCRTPTETNCAQCCDYHTPNGNCLQYTTSSNDTEQYVSTTEPCLMLCFPCARCLEAEETEWLTILQAAEDSGCDCAAVEPGIDPCFSPDSCECICQRHGTLAESCDPATASTYETACPNGYWPQSDGTPSCACTAKLEMTIIDNALDTSLVTMDAESSLYFGGIDRLDLRLSWRFDDPPMEDEEITVDCQVSLELMTVPHTVPPWNIMVDLTDTPDSTSPFVVCNYFEYPTADPVQMQPTDGFVSLRRNAELLEGHIFIIVADFNNDDRPITISGPFETPMPNI